VTARRFRAKAAHELFTNGLARRVKSEEEEKESMAKPIVLKVNLNQQEYDSLALVAASRGLNLGDTIRTLIHELPPSNDGLEITKCQQVQ
jgi:hypothetical protein